MTFYTFFDRLATFITSMAIVILILIPFMGYRFFEFHTLFNLWLPIPDPGTRSIASGLISSVMVVTTLLFMVNSKSLFPGNKLALFIISFVINFFFWTLPGAGDSPLLGGWPLGRGVLFPSFISLLIASMDYGFAHLFDRKWKSRNIEHDLSTLEQTISNAKQDLSIINQQHTESLAKEKELQAFIRQHTCPKCGEIFPSPRSVNAHKANCKSKHYIQ